MPSQSELNSAFEILLQSITATATAPSSSATRRSRGHQPALHRHAGGQEASQATPNTSVHHLTTTTTATTTEHLAPVQPDPSPTPQPQNQYAYVEV